MCGRCKKQFTCSSDWEEELTPAVCLIPSSLMWSYLLISSLFTTALCERLLKFAVTLYIVSYYNLKQHPPPALLGLLFLWTNIQGALQNLSWQVVGLWVNCCFRVTFKCWTEVISHLCENTVGVVWELVSGFDSEFIWKGQMALWSYNLFYVL